MKLVPYSQSAIRPRNKKKVRSKEYTYSEETEKNSENQPRTSFSQYDKGMSQEFEHKLPHIPHKVPINQQNLITNLQKNIVDLSRIIQRDQAEKDALKTQLEYFQKNEQNREVIINSMKDKLQKYQQQKKIVTNETKRGNNESKIEEDLSKQYLLLELEAVEEDKRKLAHQLRRIKKQKQFLAQQIIQINKEKTHIFSKENKIERSRNRNSVQYLPKKEYSHQNLLEQNKNLKRQIQKMNDFLDKQKRNPIKKQINDDFAKVHLKQDLQQKKQLKQLRVKALTYEEIVSSLKNQNAQLYQNLEEVKQKNQTIVLDYLNQIQKCKKLLIAYLIKFDLEYDEAQLVKIKTISCYMNNVDFLLNKLDQKHKYLNDKLSQNQSQIRNLKQDLQRSKKQMEELTASKVILDKETLQYFQQTQSHLKKTEEQNKELINVIQMEKQVKLKFKLQLQGIIQDHSQQLMNEHQKIEQLVEQLNKKNSEVHSLNNSNENLKKQKILLQKDIQDKMESLKQQKKKNEELILIIDELKLKNIDLLQKIKSFEQKPKQSALEEYQSEKQLPFPKRFNKISPDERNCEHNEPGNLQLQQIIQKKQAQLAQEKSYNRSLWQDNKKLKEIQQKTRKQMALLWKQFEAQKRLQIDQIKQKFQIRQKNENKNIQQLSSILKQKNTLIRKLTQNNQKAKLQSDFYKNRVKQFQRLSKNGSILSQDRDSQASLA